MSKVSDKDLSDGLRTRRKPAEIDAEVQTTIVSQMVADAMRIPLDQIRPSRYQVRTLDEEALEDLMASIVDTKGLITPIVVRPHNEGGYELVAGHTRYTACQRLGYSDISAVVRLMTDAEAAIALVADNLTRKDLSDYEIHKHLQDLRSNGFLRSQIDAARLLGRSRADIQRYEAFGKLPDAVIELLETYPSLIGGTTAKAILTYPAERVIDACKRLANGALRTQQALLTWLSRQNAEPQDKKTQRVLNANGKTVGRLTWGAQTLRVSGADVDYDALGDALQRELERQGFRF